MTLLVPTFPQQGRFPVSGEASGYVEFRTCKALPFFSGAGSPSVRRFQLLWHERFSHGGDLKSLAEEACRPERDILDFSVNLRPEGMPEFIVSALWKAMENAVPYPSPDAADLRELAAVHYGLPSGCFVFGNGANELIHALPRALNLKQAVIPEPAFPNTGWPACATARMFFPSGRRNEIPSSRLFAVWRNRPQTEALFFWQIPAIRPAACWTQRPCTGLSRAAPKSSGSLTNLSWITYKERNHCSVKRPSFPTWWFCAP